MEDIDGGQVSAVTAQSVRAHRGIMSVIAFVLAMEAREGPNTQDRAEHLTAATGHQLEEVIAIHLVLLDRWPAHHPTPSLLSDSSGSTVWNLTSILYEAGAGAVLLRYWEETTVPCNPARPVELCGNQNRNF